MVDVNPGCRPHADLFGLRVRVTYQLLGGGDSAEAIPYFQLVDGCDRGTTKAGCPVRGLRPVSSPFGRAPSRLGGSAGSNLAVVFLTAHDVEWCQQQ